MVQRQIAAWGERREFAYEDGALPIAASQTISQPYILASMIDAAGIRPEARVLEVGAGSGYAAAVAFQVADRVIATARHEELAKQAQKRIASRGYPAPAAARRRAPPVHALPDMYVAQRRDR